MQRGRRRAGVRAGGARAQPPARGALAARAPAGGERGGGHARRGRRRGRRRPRPTRRSSRCATACSPTASASTSTTRPGATWPRSPRSSCSSTTRARSSIPPQVSSSARSSERRRPGRGARRAPRRRRSRCARAERGDKRRILELAERNARLALDQERLRSERRRQQRVEALDGLQQALGLDALADADRVLRHLEPRRHAHGRLDGRLRGRRAEEVRLPALQRSAARRGRPDDFASMDEVLGRRLRAVGAPAGALAARPRATTRASPRCRA